LCPFGLEEQVRDNDRRVAAIRQDPLQLFSPRWRYSSDCQVVTAM
jgi:hypothetical protein